MEGKPKSFKIGLYALLITSILIGGAYGLDKYTHNKMLSDSDREVNLVLEESNLKDNKKVIEGLNSDDETVKKTAKEGVEQEYFRNIAIEDRGTIFEDYIQEPIKVKEPTLFVIFSKQDKYADELRQNIPKYVEHKKAYPVIIVYKDVLESFLSFQDYFMLFEGSKPEIDTLENSYYFFYDGNEITESSILNNLPLKGGGEYIWKIKEK